MKHLSERSEDLSNGLVAQFFRWPVVYPARQGKTDTEADKASHPIEGTSSGGQRSAGTKEAGAVCLFPVTVVHIVTLVSF